MVWNSHIVFSQNGRNGYERVGACVPMGRCELRDDRFDGTNVIAYFSLQRFNTMGKRMEECSKSIGLILIGQELGSMNRSIDFES